MRANNDELMTPAEFARGMNVDAKTIGRWCKTGRLRCIRTLGGHRRLYRADYDAIRAGTYVVPIYGQAVRAEKPRTPYEFDLDIDAEEER